MGAMLPWAPRAGLCCGGKVSLRHPISTCILSGMLGRIIVEEKGARGFVDGSRVGPSAIIVTDDKIVLLVVLDPGTTATGSRIVLAFLMPQPVSTGIDSSMGLWKPAPTNQTSSRDG
eukprot:2964209-Rhodomonas_salina.1